MIASPQSRPTLSIDRGGGGGRPGRAHVTPGSPGLGDAHLYRNNLEQERPQLSRLPQQLPKVTLDPAVTDLFAFRDEHFTLEDYDPHPHIAAEVAV